MAVLHACECLTAVVEKLSVIIVCRVRGTPTTPGGHRGSGGSMGAVVVDGSPDSDACEKTVAHATAVGHWGLGYSMGSVATSCCLDNVAVEKAVAPTTLAGHVGLGHSFL